jgi:carbon monoxide dehydrogenase subunit G
MARYRTTVAADAPPERVFAWLADFANTVAWDPGVAEARRLDRGALAEGSRFHVVADFFGRRVPIDYEIVRLDAPARVELVGQGDGFRSIDVIEVAPAGRGARVTYDAKLELAGWRRLADPLLHLAFQIVGARAAAGLRRALARLAADGGRPAPRAPATRAPARRAPREA